MRIGYILTLIFVCSQAHAQDGFIKNIFNKLGNLSQTIKCSIHSNSCCEDSKKSALDPYDKKTWEEYGFTEAETGRVSTAEFNHSDVYTHELDISFAALKNAGWNPRTVAASIENVAKIFAQCGIKLGQVMIASGKSPHDRVTGDTKTDGLSHDIALQAPQMKKPTVYLINAAYSDTSFSFIFLQKTQNPLHNTSWVTQQSLNSYKKQFKDPLSILVAHEVAHVLIGKDTHYKGSDKNLLSDIKTNISDKLNPQQCAEMKRNPLLKKL